VVKQWLNYKGDTGSCQAVFGKIKSIQLILPCRSADRTGVKKYFGFISFRFSAPLFAQKIVHAAQKNVHPNLLTILNVNDIKRLVSGMLVAF